MLKSPSAILSQLYEIYNNASLTSPFAKSTDKTSVLLVLAPALYVFPFAMMTSPTKVYSLKVGLAPG